MPPQPVYCSENNLFRVRAGYDDLKRPPYDSSRAGRGRVGQAGWLLQNFSPPGTFSFACQKRTRKAPATFEAREARIKGCSPLIIPKQLGSIQKIQVASLKDFLCCADLKSLARRNVRATACFHADVNAPAGSQHQQMPFAVTTLPVKKQLRNGRSRFGVANKNTISAIYAQSEAESIPNRLSRFNAPSQNPPARLHRSGGAPVSAPASRRIPGGTVPETAPAPAAVRCRSPSKSRTSRW
jgi:hypothetical protein